MNSIDLNGYLLNNRAYAKMTGLAGREKTAAATAATTKTQGQGGTQAIDKQSPLYGTCREFEAIFIKQMLNVMRQTIHKTELTDGGMAEDIFEDMLYDEYAKKMAETARFGLADTLYRQLSRKTE